LQSGAVFDPPAGNGSQRHASDKPLQNFGEFKIFSRKACFVRGNLATVTAGIVDQMRIERTRRVLGVSAD
jgi:hypothetical protein